MTSDEYRVRMDPVFVVGYSRSGTTLLRLMLNAHSKIAIPPESELFRHTPMVLGRKRYSEDATSAVVTSLMLLQPFFGKRISSEEIREIVKQTLPADTATLIAALYQDWARGMGKPDARWGDKKPQHWQFIDRLKSWYPASQFVHIIRDPRDVVASIEQTFPEHVVGRKYLPAHVISAWQWQYATGETERQGRLLGPERFMSLRYADLTHDPETVCREICRFLRLEYEPRMLEFRLDAADPRIQGARPDRGRHPHTLREVHRERLGRYQDLLPSRHIGEIEYICEQAMKRYGIQPTSSRPPPLQRIRLTALRAALDTAWVLRRRSQKLRGSL